MEYERREKAEKDRGETFSFFPIPPKSFARAPCAADTRREKRACGGGCVSLVRACRVEGFFCEVIGQCDLERTRARTFERGAVRGGG